MSHFYKVGGGGEEGIHLSEDPELEKASSDNSVDPFLLCYIVVKNNSSECLLWLPKELKLLISGDGGVRRQGSLFSDHSV